MTMCSVLGSGTKLFIHYMPRGRQYLEGRSVDKRKSVARQFKAKWLKHTSISILAFSSFS